MKKNLFISLILIGIMILTSCESRSGDMQPVTKPISEATVLVKVLDTYPEGVIDSKTGLTMYKTKVKLTDESVTFVLTLNQFENGDLVYIKKSNFLNN